MIRDLARLLLAPRPATAQDHVNLRLGFALYLAWMAALCAIAVASLHLLDGGSATGEKVWLLTIMAFYLSLCCTFCPLPTAWIVMLLASNDVALVEDRWLRLVLVASVGALGTAIANLAEYYAWTFLTRFGRVARIRDTRVYRWAARWFGIAPFGLLVLVSFIPIPVDAVRWLAVLYRYPRRRFFAAYYVGRWGRYATWAAVTIWLGLRMWHIIVLQGVIVIPAVAQAAASLIAKRRTRTPEAAEIGADAEVRPVHAG